MPEQQQMTIRMNKALYRSAKAKCHSRFGIGLSPLIKIFLTSFVSQRGVGFYVGDDDLSKLFNRWLSKKSMEKSRKGCAPLPGPRLRDIYELSNGSPNGSRTRVSTVRGWHPRPLDDRTTNLLG